MSTNSHNSCGKWSVLHYKELLNVKFDLVRQQKKYTNELLYRAVYDI